MYLIDNIVALAVCALAGMGVGGGGLFVIYLTLVKGIEQLCAQGINLILFISGCIPSLAIHVKKRKMRAGIILISGISGVVGAMIGYLLLKNMNSGILRVSFGALLTASGVLSLIKKEKQ